MTTTLYIYNGSPPVRTSLITANAVGLPFDVYVLKSGQELKSPEMLKMNPQHTVPFLNDDGKIINDSHAIAIYLVEKYGKDKSLYPIDIYHRSVVNERMFYDASVMFPALKGVVGGFIRKEFKTLPKDKIESLEDVYKTLESFLDKHKWIAGNHVTVADFCCGTTISSLDHMYPIAKSVYPKLEDWLNRVTKLSYFESDKEQFEHFKKFVYNFSTSD